MQHASLARLLLMMASQIRHEVDVRDAKAKFSLSYRSYMLAILTIIFAFNFIDRHALGIAFEDIKADLDLSDTQLGLLSGIAFAFFYALMGLPLARWADRGDRIVIVALTTGLWSLAVGLSGAATTFALLLLIRIGVAVGEAGCHPTGQSLIADFFNRSERPRATAIYMMGGPISLVVGYFVAGWLNELVGWRMMFVILALPGFVLVPLALFTLREPRRALARNNKANATPPQASPSFNATLQTLWEIRTFRTLLMGYALLQFFSYGILQWQPAFFMRSHGLSPGELGTYLAVVYGTFGVTGTYLGGELATRFAANDEGRQLTIAAAGFVAVGAAKIGAFNVADQWLALFLFAVGVFGTGLAATPIFSVLQTLVPPSMRATAVAIVSLAANLIGIGLGPLGAGMLSDLLRPEWGEQSLRYALTILCVGFVPACFLLWQSGRSIGHDLARLNPDYAPVAHGCDPAEPTRL